MLESVSLKITHFAFDVWGHAEEQGPIEPELDHVVPILRWQDSLKDAKRDLPINIPKTINVSISHIQTLINLDKLQ